MLTRVDLLGHPIQHTMIPSAKISRQKILRSLESDLELVYVAKLCLIWEALHYQYRKVESLNALSDDMILFHADISEKFQNFRIIIERFMEGEKCNEGKKYLDFICDRISFNGLLQIPDVTGNKNLFMSSSIKFSIIRPGFSSKL